VVEVIRQNVSLIPKLWLRGIILKILKGVPITPKQDLKPFPVWIALYPAEKKQDKELIDILYRVTQYEGIKGLARYNDLG
jgi:hypothetical protein